MTELLKFELNIENTCDLPYKNRIIQSLMYGKPLYNSSYKWGKIGANLVNILLFNWFKYFS